MVFLVERTDEYTDTGPTSLLGESLGYAGISNLPYNDEGWRLNTLYWDQKFQVASMRWSVVSSIPAITSMSSRWSAPGQTSSTMHSASALAPSIWPAIPRSGLRVRPG